MVMPDYPFHIGSKVICVKTFDGGDPRKGDIFTVRGYSCTLPDKYGVYTYFVEKPDSHSFGSNYFRLLESSQPPTFPKVADWQQFAICLSDNSCARCGAPLPCGYHS